jgi:hypothetical protein
MYCKFLKLTSGEDLIVTTSYECIDLLENKYIEFTEPVEIHSMKMPYRGGFIESYVMQPWLKMAAKEVMRIPAQNILVATNVMAKAETQYRQFILENDETTIATDEDIEQASAGDDIDDEFEEDDDYDSRTDSTSRTYH